MDGVVFIARTCRACAESHRSELCRMRIRRKTQMDGVVNFITLALFLALSFSLSRYFGIALFYFPQAHLQLQKA